MNPELDNLIKYLKEEIAFLKSEIDHAISDWDFEGANLYKQLYFEKKKELKVLQHVVNPNFKRIESLKLDMKSKVFMLNRFQSMHLDRQNDLRASESLEQQMKKISKELEVVKNKLDDLQSSLPPFREDNDKVYFLLVQLVNREISKLRFELYKDDAYLLLIRSGQDIVFQFEEKSSRGLRRHFNSKAIKTLQYQLGFDMSTLSMTKSSNSLEEVDKILEILSIIFFEVLDLVRDQWIYVEVSN